MTFPSPKAGLGVRVQAKMAGIAVGNKGAEPDPIGQLPVYPEPQRLKHKEIRCQIEIEPTRKREIDRHREGRQER